MDKQRFMTHVVIKDNGCWIWLGSHTGKGYGKCAHDNRTLGAHVVSHLLFKGPVEKGLVVRHKCNVRDCVNPDHLHTGTYSDNLQDALEANGRIGRIPQISDETVLAVYKARCEGMAAAEIGVRVGLTVDAVTGLLSGSFRKNLKDRFEQENGVIPKFHAGHKFSEEDRTEMIRLYKEGKYSSLEIAAMYGTNYKYVWKLAHSKNKESTIS